MVMAHMTPLILLLYLENTICCSFASHLILHISSRLLTLVSLVHFNTHGLINVMSLLMIQAWICPVRKCLHRWELCSKHRASTSAIHVPSSFPGIPTQSEDCNNSDSDVPHDSNHSDASNDSSKSADKNEQHNTNSESPNCLSLDPSQPAVPPPIPNNLMPPISTIYTPPIPGPVCSIAWLKSHPGWQTPAPSLQAENAELWACIAALESLVATAEAHAKLAYTKVHDLKRQLNIKTNKSKKVVQTECWCQMVDFWLRVEGCTGTGSNQSSREGEEARGERTVYCKASWMWGTMTAEGPKCTLYRYISNKGKSSPSRHCAGPGTWDWWPEEGYSGANQHSFQHTPSSMWSPQLWGNVQSNAKMTSGPKQREPAPYTDGITQCSTTGPLQVQFWPFKFLEKSSILFGISHLV